MSADRQKTKEKKERKEGKTKINHRTPVEGSGREVGVREQPGAADVETLEDLVQLLALELVGPEQDGAEVLDGDLAASRDVGLQRSKVKGQRSNIEFTGRGRGRGRGRVRYRGRGMDRLQG